MNFWMGAALLCLLSLFFVLAPSLVRGGGAVNRRSALVAITRARLAELQAERAAGALDDSEYRQMVVEQERRLLEDTEALAEPARVKPARALLLVFAVAVPLLAAGAYYYLGGWTDWRVQTLLEQNEREFQAGADNRGTLEALRTALQQRLAQREDKDGRRRFMLARIDIESGRYREAAEQFSLLRRQFPEDASIAAQYAQALYLALNRT